MAIWVCCILQALGNPFAVDSGFVLAHLPLSLSAADGNLNPDIRLKLAGDVTVEGFSSSLGALPIRQLGLTRL